MKDTKTHIPQKHIRPRFSIYLSIDSDQLCARVRTKLEDGDGFCVGHMKKGFGYIKIPQEDRHYWTPQLSLSCIDEKEGTLLRGVYGPNPSVWTMFVFFYAFIGLVLLIVSLIGLSNWYLGQSAMILWWAPVLIGALLTVFWVAEHGKRMGANQTKILHDFIEDAIHENIYEK